MFVPYSWNVSKKAGQREIISVCKSLLTYHNFDETGSCNTNTPDCSNGSELIADWCCFDMFNTVCVKHHHPSHKTKSMYPFFMVRLQSWLTACKCHNKQRLCPPCRHAYRQSWPDQSWSVTEDIDPNWWLAWTFSLLYCFDSTIAMWHLFACCLYLAKWTLSPRHKSCVGACDSWCHSSSWRMSQRIRFTVISCGVT